VIRERATKTVEKATLPIPWSVVETLRSNIRALSSAAFSTSWWRYLSILHFCCKIKIIYLPLSPSLHMDCFYSTLLVFAVSSNILKRTREPLMPNDASSRRGGRPGAARTY